MPVNKLVFCAIILLAALGCMLFGLDLPRVARANGYVDSSAVPIKIYSPIAATVTKIHAQNGQSISLRTPLIYATTERPQGGTFVEVQQREMLRSRLQQLRFESARAQESGDSMGAGLNCRVLNIAVCLLGGVAYILRLKGNRVLHKQLLN